MPNEPPPLVGPAERILQLIEGAVVYTLGQNAT
jgi:hypothetical protein